MRRRCAARLAVARRECAWRRHALCSYDGGLAVGSVASTAEHGLTRTRHQDGQGAAMKGAGYEPVAIVGIGCRFADADDPEAFWRLLYGGKDAIRELPVERFDRASLYDPNPGVPGKTVSRWGAWLPRIDEFDEGFFGIAPREAQKIDPQQRLLLEVCWEALEDAGIVPEALVGSGTGVFVGLSYNDYEDLAIQNRSAIDIYTNTGGFRGVAAGRISYAFGFEGPSVAVDTACSSSLTAVHLALQSLQAGESDLALAGGANVILHPAFSIGFSSANMLSPDGRCKFGGARANGFVRSEGVGLVVLKPLRRALEDGDRIYAVIRGSAANNDGASGGLLMTPSRLGQERLLRAAYRTAGIAPAQVQYVEAHGTGTAIGDPIELGAISNVLGAKRALENPLWVGSAKTNIGHTEAAAGVAGLIKTALALQRRKIPASLHCDPPSAKVAWGELGLRVVSRRRRWPRRGEPAAAGVSSFGIGGSNVHVVLTRASATRRSRPRRTEGLFLPLSARSQGALRELSRKYSRFLREAEDFGDVCYTASARRTHHPHRIAVVAGCGERLGEALREYAEGGQPCEVLRPTAAEPHGAARRIAFVFSGQGSQWHGMGRSLLEQEPVFRDSLRRTAAFIERELGLRLEDELYGSSNGGRLERVDVIQPSIFAVQVALAELWQSWGVRPDAVVGHSMGEVAAARVAGILSLADASRIVCQRSRIVQERSPRGAMAVVELSPEEAGRWVEGRGNRVSVAAQNSERETLIAGDPEAVADLCNELGAAGVFARAVKVDYASHSSQMDALLGPLGRAIGRVRARRGGVPLYSTVTGNIATSESLTTGYWKRNLREPVLFGPSLRRAIGDGCRTLIEISPHPVLLNAIRENLREGGGGTAIGSMHRERTERPSLLEGLGQLYANGLVPDWRGLYRRRGRCVGLPTYAWQRSRFWIDGAGAAEPAAARRRVIRSRARAREAHPLLEKHLRLAEEKDAHYWELELGGGTPARFADHRIGDTAVFPAAGFVEMALAAAEEAFGEGAHTVEEMRFERLLPLDGPDAGRLQLTMRRSLGNRVAIRFLSSRGGAGSEWTLHATGSIRLSEPAPRVDSMGAEFARIRARAANELSADEHYAAMRRRRLVYGDAFRGVAHVWRRRRGVIAEIQVPKSISCEIASYRIHPAVLDAGFQSLIAALPGPSESTFLPVSLARFRVLGELKEIAWAHTTLREEPGPNGGVVGDLRLYGEDGRLLADAEGLEVKAIDEPLYERSRRLIYELSWPRAERRKAVLDQAAQPGTWLVAGSGAGIEEALRTALTSRGERCLMVRSGAAFAPGSSERFEVRMNDRGDWKRVLEGTGGNGRKVRGIVYLGGVAASDADAKPSGPLTPAAWTPSVHAAQLIRALIERPETLSGSLWLVTRRAHVLGSESRPIAALQAPIWGLGSVAAQEHPELRCVRIDVDAGEDREAAELLCEELLRGSSEEEVALRPHGRYARRLMPAQPTRLDSNAVRRERVEASGSGFRVEVEQPGSIEYLRIRETERRAPGPGEVEIEVSHVGLNFRDVLLTLDVIPSTGFIELGCECVGTVSRIGPGSDRFKLGDVVLAVGRGCLGRFAIVSCDCCVPKPDGMSRAEAATLPLAFLTAHYALHDVGRIRAGERILIHAASGGVGFAAVQLAQGVGAEVFATAGSEEKHAFLRASGVTHVFGSRSLEFVDEIRDATHGEGVDLVLNSLAGEGTRRGLELLRPFGRFLELGKRDMAEGSQIPIAALRRNLSFHLIDLESVIVERPDRIRRLFGDVFSLFRAGGMRPVPHTEFAVSDVVGAFRQLAEAKHIGKVVVSLADPKLRIETGRRTPQLRADGTQVITGGLGGIGGVLAKWLVERGARNLALVSRNAPSAAASAGVRALEEAGARVRVFRADVSDATQLERCLAKVRESLPPIRGVFHVAGVLDDALLTELGVDRFDRVMGPKMQGSWNLDRATTADPLEFFVLFSSAAAVLGTAGQANYAAANAYLDALAHDRRRRGLPGLSVNWGPWSEVGLAAARAERGRRLEARGLGSIGPDEALEALGLLLAQEMPQACVMRFDASEWTASNPAAARSALLAGLWRDATAGATEPRGAEFRRGVAGARTPGERRDRIEKLVRVEVARVLRLPAERLDQTTALKELGLDSLMAVELRNRLAALLGLRLSATLAFNHPTLDALIEHLNERLAVAVEGESSSEDGLLLGGAECTRMNGEASLPPEERHREVLRGGCGIP